MFKYILMVLCSNC